MNDKWDEIEGLVRRVEAGKLEEKLEKAEREEGFLGPGPPERAGRNAYMTVLGAVALGVTTGVFAMIVNFLIFILLLHVDMNF